MCFFAFFLIHSGVLVPQRTAKLMLSSRVHSMQTNPFLSLKESFFPKNAKCKNV